MNDQKNPKKNLGTPFKHNGKPTGAPDALRRLGFRVNTLPCRSSDAPGSKLDHHIAHRLPRLHRAVRQGHLVQRELSADAVLQLLGSQ